MSLIGKRKKIIMNTIETTVPISIDNLKIYFSDKNTNFLIDYDNSTLKEEKFLIYLSNLDLPCDVKFDHTKKEHLELLKIYLNSKHLVNLPSIENEVLCLLTEFKNLGEHGYKSFIEENKDSLKQLCSVLDSLTLYNFYCLNSEKFKEHVKTYDVKSSDGIGINFVNLLKYPEYYTLYEKVDQDSLFYYEDFFNEYMFKGKNLYHYWSNENNPIFLMTWGLSNPSIDLTKYTSNIGKENASPVQ